jgi:hypothetical protein
MQHGIQFQRKDYMNRRTLQIAAKVGLMLVVFGFLLPISCDKNGFQISDSLNSSGNFFSGDTSASILLYVLFISAALGAALLLIDKHSLILDWALFAVSLGSGIISISLVEKYSAFSTPQIGGYLMALGYLVTGMCLILATWKNRSSSSS